MEALKARGWEIMDFDSSLFFPQDTGVLTLRSSRGDYWMQVGDTPMINNVVLKEIPQMACFELTLKFTFFNNSEPHQQCGIYFLDKDYNRINNIRMTYVNLGEGIVQNEILNRGIQIIKMSKNDPTGFQRFEFLKNDTNNYNLYFKIIKNVNNYKFLFRIKEEYNAFTEKTTMDFSFEPRYIALVAFNCYRMSKNGPLNTASSIPAKFDWIKIQECE